MNYGMEQKIKVFNWVSDISEKSPDARADKMISAGKLTNSKLQLKKFRENAAIIEKYRQQASGKKIKSPVTKKQTEKAWSTLRTLCSTVLPLLEENSPVYASVSDKKAAIEYRDLLTECSRVMDRGDRFEAQMKSIPEGYSPLAATEKAPGFRSADALTLVEELTGKDPLAKLNRLVSDPVLADTLTGDPGLRFSSLASDLRALNDYRLHKPGDVEAGAAKAFADIRTHGDSMLRSIDGLLGAELPGSKKYEALQEYKLLLMDCRETVAVADQRTRMHQFEKDREELSKTTEAIESVIKPYQIVPEDEGEELPSEGFGFELREVLSDYVLHGASENSFETEYEILGSGINTIRDSLPAGMTEHLADYRTPEELAKLHDDAEKEKRVPGSSGNPMVHEYAQHIDAFIDMRIMQSKQAILVSQNKETYDRYAADLKKEIVSVPEDALRSSLKTMADQLNGMHKVGVNSSSYRAFRKALNEAAVSGDLGKLYETAQNYIRDKGNPRSENGIRRLSMARSVTAMLEGLEKKKSVPAPKPAPIQEEELLPSEKRINLDIDEMGEPYVDSVNIDSRVFNGAEMDKALEEQKIASDKAKENALREKRKKSIQENDKKFRPMVYRSYQPKTSMKAQKLPKNAPLTETMIEAQDNLSWPDTDQRGFSRNREAIRSAIQANSAIYPPENHQAIADTVYGLINRHLSGHDLNGYANFINSAREALFEEHDGKAPLMDAKDDFSFLHTIGQLIVHNSDFIPKQVALYRELKEKDPDVNPFNQPNALTSSVPKITGEEKINELKAKRVLDMLFNVDVSRKDNQKYTLHHVIYTEIYYGSEKQLEVLAHSPQRWFQELSDMKESDNMYYTETGLTQYLDDDVKDIDGKNLYPLELDSQNLYEEHTHGLSY